MQKNSVLFKGLDEGDEKLKFVSIAHSESYSLALIPVQSPTLTIKCSLLFKM